MKQNSIVKVEGLSYSYGAFPVLKDVFMELFPGEMLFVTGESGAGKSTLLKLLAGEIPPVLSSGEMSKRKGLKIATVRQNILIMENFSLMDNLWVSFQKDSHASSERFLNEALELAKYFDIFEKLDIPLKKANGGLKQIVTLIRGLLARPDLLILDEPTKSLDEKKSIKAFELMNYYCRKQNMAVLWASHNRSLIKQFSGKMIHLESGRIVYSGQACFI